MSKTPEIIITARCGKAARANNEDNCLVRADLSQEAVSHKGDTPSAYLSETIELGSKGCLLVVADGMGGMNAGEVASLIAVEAVSNFFDAQLKNDLAGEQDEDIFRMIKESVVYANENIIFDAEKNPDHSGMGTTIAILWLLNGKAYVGWCGDSRIYRFNTITRKLERLTHDHSLVQLLVDEGDISEAEAFDHPKNNIIMRSLGDTVEKVKPETLKEAVPLCNGDVFLLCSDGLYGALPDNPRDSKLPVDVNIETILNTASEEYGPNQLDKWNNLLWEKAKERWHDNVTSILCHVSNCGREPEPVRVFEPKQSLSSTQMTEKSTQTAKWVILAAVLLVVLVGLFFVMKKIHPEKDTVTPLQTEETVDTVGNVTPDSVEVDTVAPEIYVKVSKQSGAAKGTMSNTQGESGEKELKKAERKEECDNNIYGLQKKTQK